MTNKSSVGSKEPMLVVKFKLGNFEPSFKQFTAPGNSELSVLAYFTSDNGYT